MTVAFLAVNEPFEPAAARRYVAKLFASAAFTAPLKLTMIWVTAFSSIVRVPRAQRRLQI
jgi:hypothetical protein